jgi:hypothetical protein
MPCAGADAFLVLRRARAEALGLPYVRILATIERHNAFPTIRSSIAVDGRSIATSLRAGRGRPWGYRRARDL